MRAIGILVQDKKTTIWINLYAVYPFGKFRYYGNNTIKDLWRKRKQLKIRLIAGNTEAEYPQIRLSDLLARCPYITVGLTTRLGYRRFVWFNNYKCDSFRIICLLGLYIRICPNKEIYDKLPQAG